MNNCENRHVCFADLQNYIRRDSYFTGYSLSERKLIAENLGLNKIVEDLVKNLTDVVEIPYSKLNELITTESLSTSCIYLVNDFQTIYKSNTGEVWGLDNHPSKIYKLIILAFTPSVINPNVYVLSDDPESIFWEVKYNPEKLIIDGISTKGKIVYLKDQNNNSAFFDFKNIQYRVSKEDFNKVGIENEDKDLHILTEDSYNVTIYENSNLNIFINGAENVIVLSNSNNNLYNQKIINTIVTSNVNNIFANHSILSDNILKTISYGPILSYFDKDTLTQLIYEIDNIR